MRAFRSISWWLYRRSTKLWGPSLVNSQRRPHGRSSVNGRGNNWKEIVWDGYTGFMISKSWRRNKRNNDNRNERKLPNPPIQLKNLNQQCAMPRYNMCEIKEKGNFSRLENGLAVTLGPLMWQASSHAFTAISWCVSLVRALSLNKTAWWHSGQFVLFQMACHLFEVKPRPMF